MSSESLPCTTPCNFYCTLLHLTLREDLRARDWGGRKKAPQFQRVIFKIDDDKEIR